MAFVFRAVDEVGATLNCALVVMGDKLGYYRALADHGATTPAELGERTGTDEHYTREWLNAQAAGGYVTYDPDDRPLHAARRARRRPDRREQPRVPARLLPDRGRHRPRRRALIEAAPDGDGLGWHEHNSDVHDRLRALLPARVPGRTWWTSGCRRSTGSSTSSSAGARVADVGCGHGASTVLMAQAFPQSTFVGSDYHAGVGRGRPGAGRGGRGRRPGELRGRRRPAGSPAPASTS